jgi:hypothetical protein
MTRLLMIACSQRKNPAEGLLPAIARYDGPAFRVLRKYLREETRDAPCILILSAKYGLIAADCEIPDYDCRLSTASAMNLRTQVLEVARHTLQSQRLRAVGICAGKDYRVALAGFADAVPQGVQVEFIEGGHGPRLTALRRWLRGEE